MMLFADQESHPTIWSDEFGASLRSRSEVQAVRSRPSHRFVMHTWLFYVSVTLVLLRQGQFAPCGHHWPHSRSGLDIQNCQGGVVLILCFAISVYLMWFVLSLMCNFRLLYVQAGSEDGRMVANLTSLLDQCLILEPSKRMTASEALKHAFFTAKWETQGRFQQK